MNATRSVVKNAVRDQLLAGNHASLLRVAERAIYARAGSLSAQLRQEVVAILAATYGWSGGNLPGNTSVLLLAEICPESNLWKEIREEVAEEIKLLEQNN